MNYGEELAFWYLRFNGFFPIVDFVLHQEGRDNAIQNQPRTTDCDVLAIRLPHVKEAIGGCGGDWHKLFDEHIRKQAMIAVICQVKAGRGSKFTFTEDYMQRCVERFGIFESAEECADTARKLMKSNTVEMEVSPKAGNKLVIMKLLVSKCEAQGSEHITLAEIRDFIRGRFRRYPLSKCPDWHFFPSSLIQNIGDEVSDC